MPANRPLAFFSLVFVRGKMYANRKLCSPEDDAKYEPVWLNIGDKRKGIQEKYGPRAGRPQVGVIGRAEIPFKRSKVHWLSGKSCF
jgi:hypothetical protein